MNKRVIVDVSGGDGPTFVAVCSLHGNESSGELAIQNVAAAIRREKISFRGRFVGLVGNLKAHKLKVRYVDEDLNRIWSPADIEAGELSRPASVEQAERRGLLNSLSEILKDLPKDQVFVLDLHSTSSESPPFIAGRTGVTSITHDHAIAKLGLPELLQGSDSIPGTFFSYLSARGYTVLAVEGGAHENRITVEVNESIIWSLLHHIGHIDSDIPAVERGRSLLREASSGVVPRVRIVAEHSIVPSDNFKMRPGFSNFQTVKKGECLADDVRGEVRASAEGVLLFPLYQPLGDTGYYIAVADSQSSR